METWTCTACACENPEGTRFCGHCGTPRVEASADTVEPEVSEELLRGVVEGRIGERLTEGGRELPHERRLITALFADVSGFTTLADRLEPEELLEVIDPVIAGLSSVVLQYEGYIEKFAGDALLALFGAPVAHEDDAERALLCAIQMHRELARIVNELPQQAELTLHVGVNSGHGIGRILGSEARTDYAVLGDSVILAQRLESAAPRGETYVSQLTYELTHDRFEFEPVGELTLKGKTKPVFAWRLLGERSRLEPNRETVVSRRLVGREDELSALSTVLDGVVRGGGGAVTVTGDPGIGKSRLTEEAKTLAEKGGIHWLDARCLSYGAALPYWPYADLLRHFVGITEMERPEDAAARLDDAFAPVPHVVPYFARLLGLPIRERDSDVTQLEPEEFRRRLHEAFNEWLGQLSGDQPIVLSLEDVHWADASTLDLTRDLVGAAKDIRLVMYLIGRPEAKDALRDVAPDAIRVELGPLSDVQIEALIKSVLDGSPPRQLGRIVQQHTGGNPFFVQELVRSFQETGDLVPHDGVWRLRPGWEPSDLPPTLEGVLAARIDLLPLSVANALHAASVVGRRLRLPLLRAVAADLPDLDESLEHLVMAGLLDPAREQDEEILVFHHALVQDVAYGQLLRRRRRELHLRAAQAAESLYGARDDTIDLLARHLYLGEAGERAVPYLVRAGARAKGLFANDEAIVHYRHALELVPADAEVELELAGLHELVGDYNQALQHYERVRSDANDLRAWFGKAATLRKRGDIIDALSTVDDAFSTETLRGEDLTALWLEAGRTLSITGRTDQAIDVLEAGLETPGDRRNAFVGLVLVQLARLKGIQGRFDDALRHSLEAEALFTELDDKHGLATTLRVEGSAYFYLHRLEEAAETLRRGVELADRVGNAEEIGACLLHLGLVEKERENFEAAIAYEKEAIEQLERIGHEAGRAQAYANLGQSFEESGRLEEALPSLEKAAALARELGMPRPVADSYATTACVYFKRGEFALAAAKAEEATALFLEIGAMPEATEMLELATNAWREAGESKRARACTARARELVGAGA